MISLDENTSEFSIKSIFEHPYPTTKIIWIPDTVCIILDIISLIDKTTILDNNRLIRV